LCLIEVSIHNEDKLVVVLVHRYDQIKILLLMNLIIQKEED